MISKTTKKYVHLSWQHIICAICSTFCSLQAIGSGSNELLKIAISQEFENLNPAIKTMSATTYIVNMTMRAITTMRHSKDFEPDLVKEIPTKENGNLRILELERPDPDNPGKTIKVKRLHTQWEIHEGATWGDGKPVTGYDIQFTKKVADSEYTSVPERDTFEKIESIDVDPKNPKKFSITFKQIQWNYFLLGSFYPLPKHLEEEVLEKHGTQAEGYDRNSNYSVDPSNPGLYFGPYVVSEIKLGSHIVLDRNPTFYGKKPKIKRIIVKLIPNTSTIEANLRSENVDMISSVGLKFDQALALEKKIESESLPFRILFKAASVYEHIDFNLRNPILKDLNVRKAMTYAINRKELTDALFESKQVPAFHNITPNDPWFTDDPKKIVRYKYSRRKSKKLLDQAGWKLNKDGFRYKDGQKLSLEIMTTAGDKTRELVQTYLQDQWKSVGVEVTIKNEPARVLFGETLRKAKFTGMAMFAWISSPHNSPESTTHSRNIPTKDNSYSGLNRVAWKNEKADSYLDALQLEFDNDKRIELMHKYLYEYTNELPAMPLYYRANNTVIPKSLKGVKLTGHMFPETTNIEDWYFETTQKPNP